MLLAWAAPAAGDDAVELGGLMFGDIYRIPSHHLPEGDGAAGLVIRRIYLTADFDIGETWYGRARVEINQDGEFESYGFDADIKDLYVARNFGQHELVLGRSPTPTFDLIEAIWGARYLMRTPMDLQGVASRDTGVALRGPLSGDGAWKYRLMYGNGADFGAEGTEDRSIMGAISWNITDELLLDFYVDYATPEGSANRTTGQVFAGYDSDTYRWGAQYSYEDRENEPRLQLASVFLVGPVAGWMNFVGRIDEIIEPSPKGNNITYIPFDPTAPATMVLAGLEMPFSDVFRITPNVVWTVYERNADDIIPEDDLHLRLTFFLDLE